MHGVVVPVKLNIEYADNIIQTLYIERHNYVMSELEEYKTLYEGMKYSNTLHLHTNNINIML